MAAAEKKAFRRAGHRSKARHTRFTILDLFLIVILILAILGIGFRTTIAGFFAKAEPGVEVSVGFKAEGLTVEQVEKLKKEDVLFFDDEEFGRLSGFASEAQKTVIKHTDEKGNVSFETVEDSKHFVVRGTLLLQGHYSEEGLTVRDGLSLHVGKTFNIYTSSYSLIVTITEIPRK